MRGSILVVSGLVLSGLAVSALAQSSIDRSFKTTTKDCSGVQWTDAALKAYPNIASACQGVEQRDGKSYVKFAGTVERNHRGEQVAVKFKDGGTLNLTPPANSQLFVNGRKTRFSDLSRGDSLNFYIPEDQLAAQFSEDETQTRYVLVPIVYREIIREAPEQTASLPHTAGQLPLVALSGVLLLGLGAGMTFVRLRRR